MPYNNVSVNANAGNNNANATKRRHEQLPTCQLCGRIGHTVRQCGEAPCYFLYMFLPRDQGQNQNQYYDPPYYGQGQGQ